MLPEVAFRFVMLALRRYEFVAYRLFFAVRLVVVISFVVKFVIPAV